MWRYLWSLSMFVHGLGHLLFVANAWGFWNKHSARAFLFADVLHASPAVEGAAGIFWLLPVIWFIAVAQGVARHAAWSSWLALRAAAVSSAMLLLWWGGLNIVSTIAALTFNCVLIVGLLWHQHASVVRV